MFIHIDQLLGKDNLVSVMVRHANIGAKSLEK